MSDNQAASDMAGTRGDSLPNELRRFFWDCEFEDLDLTEHREFVIGRILSDGDFNALRWLRRKVGDEELRHWFQNREGRGLSPQQLRFWELILELPPEQVDRWIAERHAIGWDDRMQR